MYAPYSPRPLKIPILFRSEFRYEIAQLSFNVKDSGGLQIAVKEGTAETTVPSMGMLFATYLAGQTIQ